jgi:HD-GYP domain-containing protein (c-di-GMP phosphodiesterase class II)
VADIYDALTTDRPYRAALSLDETFAIMRAEAESGQLDRKVVGTLERLVIEWESRRRNDPTLKGYSIPGWPTAQAA